MSEIDELQSRITAAMARIGAGIEALPAAAPAPDMAEIETLRSDLAAERAARAEAEQALDEEKTANAQLGERIAALGARLKAETEELRRSLQTQKSALAQLDADLGRLREANAQLRSVNAKLREANAEGLADAALIDQGMKAELEALRSARAVDMSEAGAIMAQLGPLLAEARDLPDGEEA